MYSPPPQYPPSAEMYPPPPQYPTYGEMDRPAFSWQYPTHSHMPPPPPQYPYNYMHAAHPQDSYSRMPPPYGMEPRRMSFSASSSASTHGDEGNSRGRRSVDSGVHYHHGTGSRQRSRSRVGGSTSGDATSASHRGVYRPVLPSSQQEFQGPVPVVPENSGFVNEMIMELLEDPRAAADVEATSRLKTSIPQETQHEEANEEDEEDDGGDEEDEEEGDDSGRSGEGNTGQTSRGKSLMDRVRWMRDKIKHPDRFSPSPWKRWPRKKK